MASITSSSCAGGASGPVCVVAAGVSAITRGRARTFVGGLALVRDQLGTVPRQLGHATLAVLDRVADLEGVGSALLAHLADDLARALLVGDYRIDELFDGVGPDGRPVARLQRFLLDL